MSHLMAIATSAFLFYFFLLLLCSLQTNIHMTFDLFGQPRNNIDIEYHPCSSSTAIATTSAIEVRQNPHIHGLQHIVIDV